MRWSAATEEEEADLWSAVDDEAEAARAEAEAEAYEADEAEFADLGVAEWNPVRRNLSVDFGPSRVPVYVLGGAAVLGLGLLAYYFWPKPSA